MNMKPLKVALPPDLRGRVERAAADHHRSLGEEIRARVEQSFGWEGFDAQTLTLLVRIARLSFLLPAQCAHAWHEHAGAYEVFREALALLLSRAKPPGQPVLDPAELPADRPVASTDVTAVATALEAIISLDRPSQGGEQLELLTLWLKAAAGADRVTQKMFETHQPPQRADTTGVTRLRRKPKQEGGNE
jgi:hypothetical protein